MALPTLDATFASTADLPRRQMLAKWLVNIQYSGSVSDYATLPERYLWAKIAVAAGGPKTEADYISLPKNYVWKDIYDAISGSSAGLIQWSEKQALGHIAAAYRGDTANPANLATYIDWPWRYQVASIITNTSIDADAQAFITTSGATEKEGIDQFVKEIKSLNLWNSMVCWPLRSSQNSGTGTTAYSLGGLGTFNGTLTNGPTWGANGITFDGSNDLISFNNPLKSTALAAYSIWSVFDAAVATNQTVIGSFYVSSGTAGPVLFAGGSPIQGGSGGQLYHELSSNGSTAIGSGGGKVAASGNTGTWQSAFAGFSGTEVGLSYNATTRGTSSVASTTCWNNNTTWRIGQRLLDGGYPFNGQQAFNAIFNVYLTTSQEESIRSLYKQTLGVGLGLP